MDMPMLGEKCSDENCNNHDFLPTRCLSCSNLYCQKHYSQDAHRCSKEAAHMNTDGSLGKERANTPSCAFKECRNPCLESYVSEDVGESSRVPAKCSRCSRCFCAQHRFPDAHHCDGPATSNPPKNAAARALLAKNFPVVNAGEKGDGSRLPSRAYQKRPEKSQLTSRLQLMKMRQSAIPGDPNAGHINVPDRIHLQAKVGESGGYKTFWFPKSMSSGRAFDLLQQCLGTSPTKMWVLLKEYDDKPQVPFSTFDKLLFEEFEDGCKVLLTPRE